MLDVRYEVIISCDTEQRVFGQTDSMINKCSKAGTLFLFPHNPLFIKYI